MRTRISDVAAACGVSISTVSKALSGSHEISDTTRRRVIVAARELDYRPNGAARRLRLGSTRAVGLLTHDSVGRLSLPVLLGAEDAVGTERMSILLCDSRGDPRRSEYHLRTLLEHGIDGLIALAGDTDDQPSLGRLPVPVVYAYGASTNPLDQSIVPDEEDGARQAMMRLRARGRRRIVHVSGPESYAATARRARAWRSTIRSEQLQTVTDPLLGPWTEAWGYEAAGIVIDRKLAFDAVFCGSDIVARGVQDRLRESNIRVPEDVSVIGYDNWEMVAAGARPALTTIDMQLEDLGRQAVRALFAAIEGKPGSGVERRPTRLVIRGSD